MAEYEKKSVTFFLKMVVLSNDTEKETTISGIAP